MRIALLESPEIFFSRLKNKAYFIVEEDSGSKPFLRSNFKKNQLIRIAASSKEDAWMRSGKLKKKLSKNKIKGFLADTYGTAKLNNWAKKQGLALFGISWDLQEKLENKITFHAFLKHHHLPHPPGEVIENKKDLKRWRLFPAMVQRPWSQGGQGTFWVNDEKNLKETIRKKNLPLPLLIRKYIKGLPLGVTLFLSRDMMLCSALRLQAFFLKPDGTNDYFGIQWMPTRSLKKSALLRIDQSLRKLGKDLRQMGFYGMANIDFMLKGDQVFILECNPRFSLSMAQLGYRKELLHGYDAMEEYLKAVSGKPLSANRPFIPNTNFEGCTLDLDCIADFSSSKTVKKTCPVGAYEWNEKTFQFISESLKSFNKKKNHLLIYHTLPKKTCLTKDSDTGLALVNRPLFKVDQGEPNWTSEGRLFFKALKKIAFH